MDGLCGALRVAADLARHISPMRGRKRITDFRDGVAYPGVTPPPDHHSLPAAGSRPPRGAELESYLTWLGLLSHVD
jgi:hypothetical protein